MQQTLYNIQWADRSDVQKWCFSSMCHLLNRTLVVDESKKFKSVNDQFLILEEHTLNNITKDILLERIDTN